MAEDITPHVERFREFFESNPKITSAIEMVAMSYPEKKSFEVDCAELGRFDFSLADFLVAKPDVGIEAARLAAAELGRDKVEAQVKFEPYVRFFNPPREKELLIQDVGSLQIEKLLLLQGVITKRAEVKPKVKVAVYKCTKCDAVHKVPMTKKTIPPQVCDVCKRRALELSEEESYFVDLQKSEIQELLERLHGGAPASHIELWMEDDLVNTINPGDTVEVTGILRIKPPMPGKGDSYSKYVEVVHIQNVQREFEEVEISKGDKEKIMELSKDPKVFEKIVKSIAPSIYGHDEIKAGIALQLFGGTPEKKLPEGGNIRSDIHLLLIGDPGAAKCVSGETKVVLADGSIERIGKIVETVHAKGKTSRMADGTYAISNHDILSLDEDGRVGEDKASVFWKIEAPEHLFEIKTSTGKAVFTTPAHPFFVLSEGRVVGKKAEELRAGEFIATPRTLPIKGAPQRLPDSRMGKTNANHVRIPEFLTPKLARLLGYLIGDGYVRRTPSSYEVSLTNCDLDILDDFRGILLGELSLGSSVRTDKRNGVTSASAFSVEFGAILERMGMMANSQHKKIPVEVLKSENKTVREFIRSYFDCEGSVRKERGDIYAVSYSNELAEEMQLILLRFGIISQLHETKARATNSPTHEKTTYYRLSISGENVKLFYEQIGFKSKKKEQRLKKILTGRRFNTNTDVIPNLKMILKETRLALGLSQFDCGIPRSTYQHFERGDRNPSRVVLKKIVEEFEKKIREVKEGEKARTSVTLLKLLATSDIFWDRVVRVNKAPPKEKWVYDLQVDPLHNFIANGIAVHNTRLLQYVVELAPKSIYVSGKSVSGVGLTAAAERDELSDGGWTLKAGALVLASGGMVAVDEFDKIDEKERAAMHEVMESQTVSVAKAGIVARFKAKTSVLAAANPKFGRFDSNKLPGEQFNIPNTLLSRFDLIFPIRDIMDEEKDRRLAEHILRSHEAAALKINLLTKDETIIPQELMRKYIAYARKYVRPKLSKEANERIKEYYVDMRKMGAAQGTVPITPRYIEGMIRLSEASAKTRLSEVVELSDADIAVKLNDFVLRQIAFDKETGKIDVDIVATGQPKSKVEKVNAILGLVRDMQKEYDLVEIGKVIEQAENYNVDQVTARRLIEDLIAKGELFKPKPGFIKLVKQYD
ncbi:MAG: LAGLIDADG family homing endonuclease [Candidatus Micrarchaeota archaeon]